MASPVTVSLVLRLFLLAILLWENKGSKSLSNLPQIMKLVKRRMGFEFKTVCLQNFLPDRLSLWME